MTVTTNSDVARRGRRGLRRAAAVTALSGLLVGLSAPTGTAQEGAAGGAPAAASAQPAGPKESLPTSIAALGDSITRGFNACGFFRDCPRESWSTGGEEDVSSHRQRLLDAGATLTGHHNFAVSGARVDGLAAQAAAATRVGADYVTVLIGANDACRSRVSAMTPVDRYRSDVREGLDVLREGLPQAKVFVASVPDVKRLWRLGKDSRFARWAWHVLDVCQALLDDPRSSDPEDRARRDAVQQRVREYNAVLAEECAAYGPNCRYDDGAVFRTPFTLDDVSKWDFFHPDTSGQALLAEVTWEAGFDW